MLKSTGGTGDRNIPGIFITTGKDLEEAWEKYGKYAVYVTNMPDILHRLKQLDCACVYLEKEWDARTVCSEADYIWQISSETDFPDQRYLFHIWQRHMHLPWIIAETDRLILRESVMEDLPYFQKMYQQEKDNPDVVPLSGNGKEQLESYISTRYPFYEYGLWTVLDKESGTVIGRIGLEELPDQYGPYAGETELSYLIGKEYRRRGYAREACEEVLRYAGEELGIKRVYLRTTDTNLASGNLAEICGFLKVQSITEYKEILYSRLIDFSVR